MITREKILNFLRSRKYRPMRAPEIARKLGVKEDEYRQFTDLLGQMRREGLLVQIKKKRYAIPEKVGLAVGRLECNRGGFGFVRLLSQQGEDVYIAREDLNGAMHGDVVVIRIEQPRGKWRMRGKGPSGKVVDVVERANPTIVGTLCCQRNIWFVIPDNPRLFRDVYVAEEDLHGAQAGQKVVVRIHQWPTEHLEAAGEIIEVLGDSADISIDAVAVIREYSLREEFPESVLNEARQAPKEVRPHERRGRRDLTDELVVTIDPIDAEDFDDAVSLVQLENGWRLSVHIADVSHYVRPGSKLDEEARLRGTSVYLPGRVLPMLPRELSKGICSLQEGKDRLAKTVRVTFTLDGQPKRTEIFLSVIRSRKQLSYRRVLELLQGDVGDEPEDVRRMLLLMGEFAEILRNRRRERGSLDFDLPEVEIHLNEDGSIREIEKIERNPARGLIEEFMLAANEAVARYMKRRKLPFLHRVHMEPSMEDLLEFQRFAHAMGFIVKDPTNVRELQQLLEACKGKGYSFSINLALLCAMKRAEYSAEAGKHYALATDSYTHFTSPIRRYPDLFLHQVLEAHLRGQLSGEMKARLSNDLPSLAAHCTETERKAEDAENDLTNIKLMRLLQEHAHKRYRAHIIGFNGSGMTIRLEDYLLEGVVKFSSMVDDFYSLRADGTQIIGRYNRKKYRIGDSIIVKPAEIDIPNRVVLFTLIAKE